MASEFDAHLESDKIVRMFMDECKDLKINLTVERAECSKKMADELSTLSPDRMRDVALVLERRIPTDPTDIGVEVDSSARVSGLTFEHPENWYHPLNVPYHYKKEQ